MDDLLREFLTESGEHLDTVDAELVRFEQDPNNETILRNIFRLVHTIKGTCGFLGLPRLEALAHAAETLMGRFRDGLPATSASVTLILLTLDRLKAILADLEATGTEPAGSDDDLISALERMAAGTGIPGRSAAETRCTGCATAPGSDRAARPEIGWKPLLRGGDRGRVRPPAGPPPGQAELSRAALPGSRVIGCRGRTGPVRRR